VARGAPEMQGLSCTAGGGPISAGEAWPPHSPVMQGGEAVVCAAAGADGAIHPDHLHLLPASKAAVVPVRRTRGHRVAGGPGVAGVMPGA
jgi:hypothetical protein